MNLSLAQPFPSPLCHRLRHPGPLSRLQSSFPLHFQLTSTSSRLWSPLPILFSVDFRLATMWSRQITASLQLLKEAICVICFKGEQGPGVCCFVSSYHRRQRQIFSLDACVSPLTCTPFMLSTHHSWRKRGGRHHDVFVKYVSCFFFSLASHKSYHLHLTCPL